MTSKFDALLDQCISEIQGGHATLESCLRANPEQATALEPLLRIASHSHSILAPERPDPAFVKRLHHRIVTGVVRSHESRVNRAGRVRLRMLFNLRPAYSIVAILLVVMLLTSGIGVVGASADSLPGDSLYGVKIAAERVRLAVSLSDEGDAALLVGFAAERIEEAGRAIELGRYESLDQALTGLNSTLDEIAELDTPSDDRSAGVFAELESKLQNHLTVLYRVLDQVPENAKPAIEKAIEKSNHSQDVLDSVKKRGGPNESAPGQLKKNEATNDHPGQGNGHEKDKPEKTEKPK